MTEQEIVECLKENKTKGIACLFMHEDVWHWLGKNLNNSKLLYLAPKGTWKFFSETDFDDFDEYDNLVFTLPDNYEIEKDEEKTGEWVEFEINEYGNFKYNSIRYTGTFNWWDWQRFLKDSDDVGLPFTSFGGWLYDKSGDWFLSPQVGLIGDSGKAQFILNRYSHIYEKERITPVIPIKIRFWRENK